MGESNKKQVGQRIKSIRLSKGMTLEEFGKNFSTSKGTVNNWEKGRNLPNKENLLKIAKIGDTTVDELLCSNPLSKYTTEELEAEIDKRKNPHWHADNRNNENSFLGEL